MFSCPSHLFRDTRMKQDRKSENRKRKKEKTGRKQGEQKSNHPLLQTLPPSPSQESSIKRNGSRGVSARSERLSVRRTGDIEMRENSNKRTDTKEKGEEEIPASLLVIKHHLQRGRLLRW